MLQRRLRILAVAVATTAAVMLGGSKRAEADILLTVSAGGTTDSFDFASNTLALQALSIDGYSLTVHTVITNYPGTATSQGGFITTSINVGSATVATPLTTTVQLITPGSVVPGGPYPTPPLAYGSQPLLAWTAPSTSPVVVSAGSSFTPSSSTTTANVATTTYYDSPPALTLATSTAAVTSSVAYPPGGSVLNSVTGTNAGTYSLSQVIALTNINVGAGGFNYGGTSSVTPVPEPSTMAIAGLGALGMIGYGIRRRKGT